MTKNSYIVPYIKSCIVCDKDELIIDHDEGTLVCSSCGSIHYYFNEHDLETQRLIITYDMLSKMTKCAMKTETPSVKYKQETKLIRLEKRANPYEYLERSWCRKNKIGDEFKLYNDDDDGCQPVTLCL